MRISPSRIRQLGSLMTPFCRSKSVRGISLIVSLVFFVWLLVYWRPDEPLPPSQQTQSKPQISGDEHKVSKARIALLLPLSGPFHRDGEMLRRGVELAWKENEGKDLQVELMVIDGGKEPSVTIQRAKELAADPEVILVIAHLPVSILSQIIPLYEKEQLPLVIPANSHQSLPDHPWVFPLIMSDRMEGAFAAKVMQELGKAQAATIIYDPGPYGKLLLEGFQEEALKRQLNFEAVACPADNASILSSLSDISKDNLSVVWLAGPPLWGTRVAGALDEQGFEGRLLVPRSYGETFLEDFFGDFLPQLRIVWPVSIADTKNKAMQEFRKEFNQAFWREPNWLAVLGYDTIRWARGALQESPFSRKKIASHFLQHDCMERAYRSLSGPVFFDANGYPQRKCYVTAYKKGMFVPASLNR